MKIGIDFDRVLFKTDEFKQHLSERFKEFEETYPEAKENGAYYPGKHAEVMDTTISEIFDELEKTSKFLYDDAEKLEELRNKNKVVIVSRGDQKFQEEKIRDSGVLDFVDDFHIVEERPKDTIDIDFLVDDWKKELERVDVPGFLFDRDKHSVDDIIRKVGELDGQ